MRARHQIKESRKVGFPAVSSAALMAEDSPLAALGAQGRAGLRLSMCTQNCFGDNPGIGPPEVHLLLRTFPLCVL